MFLFFSQWTGVAAPFGDFRSNGAGHRRSHGAHRRETHAIGTPRAALSNAPGASVLPCVWTAPGAVVARVAPKLAQVHCCGACRNRVGLMMPTDSGETRYISYFGLRLRVRA